MAFSGTAGAADFTVYGAVVGEYMAKVAPTLQESEGLMFEVVAGAFKKASLPVAMAPELPWARAQAQAMREPGGILVVLAKTLSREPNWKWLSVMYTDKVFAYTMKDHPTFSSYEAIRATKPVVGAKLGSASESILKGMDVPVVATPDLDKSFMMLMLGRLDVLLMQGMEAYPALQPILSGKDADQYRPLAKDLRRTAVVDIPLWVVTSNKTSEADAQTMKDALEKFKDTVEYKAIVEKYEGRLAKLTN
jgi:ABC-type amino acid transport substrate-binding protein